MATFETTDQLVMACVDTRMTMKDDQDFNIWFVKEIEKISCLYNYTDPSYTNRQKQDDAWQKIASAAHIGVTECKERWKNLRACFTRHLKHKFLEAKSGIRYKKPYYLAEHMNFILPYTKLRSQSQEDLKYYEEVIKQQHLHHQQLKQTQQQQLQEQKQQIDNNIIYLDTTENSNDDQHSPEYDFEAEIDADMMYAENSMYSSKDDQLAANRDVSQLNQDSSYSEDTRSGIVNFKRKRPYETDEDSDILFLKSLLPDMKAMNENQKRKFKIGILKLSDDILTSS